MADHKEYEVIAIYDGHPDPALDRQLTAVAPQQCASRGYGFGERDIQFFFKTDTEAKLAAVRMKAVILHAGRAGRTHILAVEAA